MTGKKTAVKCAKCGISSKEVPSLTFHRFPLPSKQHGSLKSKVWAKFCFPNEDWASEEYLIKLHAQHKMCGKHFDDSSYTSNERKKLNNFAIPTEARSILSQLREEQSSSSGDGCKLQLRKSAAQMEVEVPTSTAQCPTSMEQSDLAVASTSQSSVTKLRKSAAQMEVEVPTSTAQCPTPMEQSDLAVASTSQSSVTKDTNKRTGILKDLDVTRCKELTPKKQKLYKQCRKNLTEIMRLRRKFRNEKKCKRSLLSTLTTNESVNEILKSKLNSSFYLLLQSQLKNVPRRLPGRRWTLDDKVLALSIYKKSSACYRLLSRLFCLPSISSIKALLNKIPLNCGINDQIIDTLLEITKNRDTKENLCVLAFDEMSIRKNICYNKKLDQLDGYQDHGSQGRTPEVATHALTFMAIGIRKKWKQPIAFYFSGNCVTADRLAFLIKEVLSACFRAGLEVVATVCDLDGVNIRAINSLGSTTEQPAFKHEGHEIVTVLDPPHLLKCFRNNFSKHNIQFTQDMQIEGKFKQGVAKWSHIEEFYSKDKENPNFVFAPALTDQHLQPNGKQKMKVRLAAQVLSHSVAAGIFAKASQNELPQEAIDTATVVSNMDKLFDAMNGDTPDKKRGKHYLTNMSSTSPHHELFKKMKDFFCNMKFLGARCKPPSQDGWLRTINAVTRLHSNLKKYDIHTLSVRRVNQDPLENCFGCIRTNCGCNSNPTSIQFVAALKTSIATNLINNNKNRNCLDDHNGLLDNFKSFLEKGNSNQCASGHPMDTIDSSMFEEIDMPQCSGEMQACAYVCGFILKNMALTCSQCKKVLLADPNTEVCHLFSSFKEYSDTKNSLNYVSLNFCKTVENAATIINSYMSKNSHKENVKLNMEKLCKNLNKDWLNGCEEHLESNFNKIIHSTIAICLKRFCKLKNNQFVEEASRNALKRKINILKHV